MNAILYARVSTERQAKNELSIPAQLQQMIEYCRKKGWGIIDQFKEEGKSARTANRPELKKLLSYCKKNRKVDVVVVHKIDRFARNVYDYAAIKAILKKENVRLVSVVENFENNISGQLVENIMASIAQFYSENLGEEVKKGLSVKIRRGEWPGWAPIGYKNGRDEDGKAIIEVDHELIPGIRKVFDLFSTGEYSLYEISSEVFTMGIRTVNNKKLSREKIKAILKNPFYTGKMLWKGKVFEGKHEPIIDEKRFFQAQEALKKRGIDAGEKGKLSFLMRGVAYCAKCGAKLTAERHPRGTYYRCVRDINKKKCNQQYIPVKKLDAQIPALYKELIPPRPVLELLKDEMEDIVKRKEKMVNEEIGPLKEKLRKEKEKQLSLADRLVSSNMPDEVYRKLNDRYQESITKMEERLIKLDRDYKTPLDLYDKCLVVSSGLLSLHQKFNLDGKKKVIKAVFEKIYVQNKKVVGAKVYSPFDFIMKDGLKRAFKDHPAPPEGRYIIEQLIDLPFSPRFREIMGMYKLSPSI